MQRGSYPSRSHHAAADSPSKYTTMMGCTLDTSGLSSSGVRWRFQSASSLLQNLRACVRTASARGVWRVPSVPGVSHRAERREQGQLLQQAGAGCCAKPDAPTTCGCGRPRSSWLAAVTCLCARVCARARSLLVHRGQHAAPLPADCWCDQPRRAGAPSLPLRAPRP
jgi:hypothetical protein